MNYASTRGFSEQRTFEDVVLEGSAPDGGLYVPTSSPVYTEPGPNASHADHVAATLGAYGASDVDDLVASAFSRFHHREVAPLRQLGPFQILEMFWGPTLSFKDHALQVLARLFERFLAQRGEKKTVLVATSGDTGSAAIEAFRALDSVRIVVLYPAGMVSGFQRRQMTTVSDPSVTVVSVRGSFDDCQRLVKEALATLPGLASANSINWGRLAAQAGYYMSLAARVGGPFEVVIPTGNFGNAYSARLAQQLGASVDRITIATNANRVLYDLHRTGEVHATAPVQTLAPAMDIQVPSNLERYLGDHPPSDFGADFNAGWADDARILETIRDVHESYGELIDPHTAAAWWVATAMEGRDIPRVIISTAHPAKFPETVARATGIIPDVPPWGVIDESLPELEVSMEPAFADLKRLLHS